MEANMSNHTTMQMMPQNERPYEKCLLTGAESLSDAELLAVIIRTGARGKQSLELSREILKSTEEKQSILKIQNLTINELMKMKGIGKVKAVQIKCIAELAKRIAKASAAAELSFTKPESIANYYMEELRHQKQEHMILVMLDTKSGLIGDKVLFKGTVNASLASPREMFIEAVKKEAVYIILLHNHPSGNPTPSQEDLQLTKRVQQAGDLMGIQLIDHIIIGDRKYVSFAENGII